MPIPLKTATFTLLFRCLSVSLSTPVSLDFTETQQEFILIYLLSNGSIFSAPVRQQGLEKKYASELHLIFCMWET